MSKLFILPLLLFSLSSILVAQVHTRDLKRHQMVMQKIELKNSYDILFLGDSITHLMDDPNNLNPAWIKNNGENYTYLAKQLAGKTLLNTGISGEDTTHLLSRLNDGIAKVQSRFTVIMIGTNDAKSPRSPEQVAANIKKSIKLVQKSNPDTQILLYAIFPRGASEEDPSHLKNQAVNKLLATLPDQLENVKFVDINKELLGDLNKVSKDVFYDLLHPTLKGYKIWIKSIQSETTTSNNVE